ncbi:hypothetical protein BWC63_17775 [Salmonella enterica subsp. enterica serovar Oslo]|nr:hypothetical protein [Salmonella enterica subsp. enterica serovar Berlin]ECU8313049.1 hypothetical protein [Salmonella enterica subsp. enterica serovar Oslo]
MQHTCNQPTVLTLNENSELNYKFSKLWLFLWATPLGMETCLASAWMRSIRWLVLPGFSVR